jgi:hypothetical protein
VVSEQVVDRRLVGGEMGGNVHVVQYVGRVRPKRRVPWPSFKQVLVEELGTAIDLHITELQQH